MPIENVADNLSARGLADRIAAAGERLAAAREHDAARLELAKLAAGDQVRAAISRCRRARGWSWRRIAAATGLTRDRVRKLDTGIGFPLPGELPIIEALAAYLEWSPDVGEKLAKLERLVDERSRAATEGVGG